MQLIPVTAGSGVIDAGGVKYNLSGDFGGFANQDDNAQLIMYFLDSSQMPIGSSVNIGGFNAAYRNNKTGLFHASTNSDVPIGTRYVEVYLTMTRAACGPCGTYDDGYADNLSLVLSPSTLYLPLIVR